ncbi:MAG TPA: UDP-N-acetylmuramoyl-L-alanyl-D-glutamate--2,6-diaminopimelate ligase [Candidatus Paceibacterota bacterium]
METILQTLKKIIPQWFTVVLRPAYHYVLSLASALTYFFPSRKIFVLGVTGTKGKTSVVEIINAILEEAGYSTAISSSLRFKVGNESWLNEKKMTMPGRFFLQKLLRSAVKEKCDYAILEMTSEGIAQYRHKFINLNALIFTNLAPEHIESHGSFEKYREAKLKLFKSLESSPKKPRTIIVNKDDENAEYFLNFRVEEKITYGKDDVSSVEINRDGINFALENISIRAKLSGEFNLYNILGAIAFARSRSVPVNKIKLAVEKFQGIAGRLERVELPQNDQSRVSQDFTIIVDYAHTPDSLEKVYQVFQNSREICVLGSCGGGRDKWKRPKLGSIAGKYCDEIILTNEDPYDENPREIIMNVASGIPEDKEYAVIEDRREAIHRAISLAKTGDTIIITGKGSEPWMMLADGKKIPWSDRDFAKEELKNVLSNR